MAIPGNPIIQDLKINYPNSGNGIGLSSLIVKSGSITFNSTLDGDYGSWVKTNTYRQKTDISLTIPTTGGNSSKFVLLYTLPNHLIKIEKNVYGLQYKLVEGSSTVCPSFPTELDGAIFLGVIFVPPMYPNSYNKIYFRSVNESDQQSTFAQTFSDFYNKTIQEVEVWTTYTLYLEKQIIRNNNDLWVCNCSHASSSLFDTDKITYWDLISSGEGSVTPDLSGLFVERLESNLTTHKNYIVTYLKIPNQDETIERAIVTKELP